jgi:hypothetical protein
MPKATQPEPNQRQTRATNVNAHPGKVVDEVLRTRRTREVIEQEKKAKNERREARNRKKANEQKAIQDIADFENRMALDNKAGEVMFPRRQTKGRSSVSFYKYALCTHL